MLPSNLLIRKGVRVRDSIASIDRNQKGIVFVVDEAGRLLGTVTDGDIRRGLLRGVGLDEPVDSIINASPASASKDADRAVLRELMRERGVKQIPLLDEQGCVVEVALQDKLEIEPERTTPVLILAGGLGRRLGALTQDTPKPLLPINGRPLLEILVEQMRTQGFRRFFVSVNYRAHKIEEDLADGARFGVEIKYLREDKPLGTAGPIRLLGDKISEPFIVINGDVLTRTQFGYFFQYHLEGRYDLTMGVKQYDMQVSYGVVEFASDRVVSFKEKPVKSFFVNAGLYALNPDVVEHIPKDSYFEMPNLIEILLKQRRAISGFPVHEYWTDIGGHAEYERAHGDYERCFLEPQIPQPRS